MRIYGIASTEDVDRTGERVLLSGMDVSECRLLNDEHASDTMFEILGHVSMAKKILTIKDCENDYQLKCWNLVKRPFLFIEGSLADEEGHPNALAAAALIKYGVQNPDFKVGLSVEGTTLERSGSNLTKTKVKNISLTVKPANPHSVIFPVADLTKSFDPVVLPEQYKNVEGRKQFKNIPDPKSALLAKSHFLQELKELAKSDPTTIDSAAIVKCWNCGQSKLFMKSRLPNRCMACSEAFTMSDIFKARNSKPLI